MTDPTQSIPDEAPERRPFTAWLLEQRRGGLAADLGEKLAEVAIAVAETGKKGTLSLTLEISPNGQGQVKISDKLAAKPPSADTPEAFFYVDAKGNLTRNDPRQPQLPGTVDELETRRSGAGEGA